MIGKILPHQKKFGTITNYALYGRDGQSPERVSWVALRNLEGATPEIAHTVMQATAAQSKRVKNPRMHMIVSWASGDRLSEEQTLAVMDQTLADLGLTEHQAIYVAHNDTEHFHVHAIINRVHPETFKTATDSHERLKLRTSLMRQENEYGLQQTPYFSRGKHDRQFFAEIEMAKREERDALLRFSKERCQQLKEQFTSLFKSANSWAALSDMLERRGYKLTLAGAGVRIVKGLHYAKLSEVLPKDVNVKRLTARWGKFGEFWKKQQRAKLRKQRRLQKRQERQAEVELL